LTPLDYAHGCPFTGVLVFGLWLNTVAIGRLGQPKKVAKSTFNPPPKMKMPRVTGPSNSVEDALAALLAHIY
jgi:hypothetical protein